MPISYTEIDSYARLMRVRITPFEARLIRHIDDIGLKQAQPRPSKGDGPALKNEVSVDDGAGVAALMRGIGAKKKPSKTRGGGNGGRRSSPRPIG